MSEQGKPGSGVHRRPAQEDAFDEAMFWVKYKGGGFKDIEVVPPAYGRPPSPEPYAFTHSCSSSDPDNGAASSFFTNKSSKGRE